MTDTEIIKKALERGLDKTLQLAPKMGDPTLMTEVDMIGDDINEAIEAIERLEQHRLFTESEVRAMVKEMVESVCAGEEFTQESIAAKHGIVLDPS
jgi:hypothetical protein